MKILEHDQGTPEWFAARLGLPTASRFHDIITPKTMKLSKSRTRYQHELLAEWLLGEPLDSASTGWMSRGIDMEAEAVAFYELLRDVDVERVGLCLTDDGRVGASPDGLVGEDGGLEIKCYGASHHVACLLGEDPVKYTQAQGALWVTGREWWDLLAYNPSMPPVLLRTHRDEKFMKALEAAMDQFLDELAQSRSLLDAMGDRGRRTDTNLEELLKAGRGA